MSSYSLSTHVPRILVGICSCQKYPEKRQAVRETWLSNPVEGCDYRFFIGGETSLPEEPDTVVLPVNDSYDALPGKVLAFFAHVLEISDFEWLFKCDDDTYLALDRLHDLVPENEALVGDISLAKRGFPSGGAGYLLSRQMVETIVADKTLPMTGAEDVIIGASAIRHGAKPLASPKLIYSANPHPRQGNRQISAHWCSPERLRAIHAALHFQPDRTFHAIHPHWEDLLDVFANGTYCRRKTGCNGQWHQDSDGALHLKWFDWVEDVLDAGFGGYRSQKMSLIAHDHMMPKTLVFSSIGDEQREVLSWLGGIHDVAVVYYGATPDANFPTALRRRVDYFAARKGGKFQNLLWWLDENPEILEDYERFLIIDDDLSFDDLSLELLVREAVLWDLPVCSPAHEPDGKISWPHMKKSQTERVTLCNFVEMGCVLFERAALRRFLEAFRPHAGTLVGWGTDYIISNACFEPSRPFGVVQSVSVFNPLRKESAGIEALETTASRSLNWEKIAHQFKINRPYQVGAIHQEGAVNIPVVCINLPRAVDRREATLRLWKPILGDSLKMHDAIDRRGIENGGITPPIPREVHRDLGRRLTSGETACLLSHLAALTTYRNLIGKEGLIVMEDDVDPLPEAHSLLRIIQQARLEAPKVDMLLLCEPVNAYFIARETPTIRIASPHQYPYGCTMVWYSPKAIDDYFARMSSLDVPADYRAEFCHQGRVGILKHPVARHQGHDTYIGNQHRGTAAQRVFMP